MKQSQLYTNKGYTEYRDYARQKLNDGYERNQGISAGSEIIGSAISTVKVHTPHSYTGSLGNRISTSADIAKSRFINSVGTGAINGAGYTNENNPAEYSRNITMGTITNLGGTVVGNQLFGKGNNMYRFGRTMMNIGTQSIPYRYNYFRKKHEDE